MSQDDILTHYESEWKRTADTAVSTDSLAYSTVVDDAVLYPIYERLIQDLRIKVSGGRVLDVGSGSGRWIRFFLDRYAPEAIVGVDFAQAAVDLLRRWAPSTPETKVTFQRADITSPSLRLDEPASFDLINIANVLFHIPEQDNFVAALRNMASLLAPGGRIVTTEYMPRATMRTEWMMVRSRYEFQAMAESVGLRIIDIRAGAFFTNDPMGIDGDENHSRSQFAQIRAAQKMLLNIKADASTLQFIRELFITIDRAAMAFCAERIAPVDMPSQKFVVLGRA